MDSKKLPRDLSPFGSESFVSLPDLVKSQEDIERFSVPEELSEEERVLYLLTKGTNMQKQSALDIFSNIAKETNGQSVNAVLQEIVENMWKYDTEIQLSCAESVVSILGVLSHAQLHAILNLTRTMVAVRNEEVSGRWAEILIELIRYLPLETCERDVLELAQSKGGLTEPVQSRVMCARFLGALAKRFDGHMVERSFFFKAMGLCQDTEYPVRIAMCDQLDAISRSVGLEATKKVVVPELSELLKDEEKEVKCAALSSLVSSLDFYDSPFRKATVLPVLKRFLSTTASSGDEFYRTLVAKLGEIMWKIAVDLEDEDDVIMFCAFFRDASQRPDPEIKRMCAYNFPGVLKSVGARRYALHLHATFIAMCEDHLESVRQCAAAGFHEVATILGKERSVQYLKDPFISLLRDEALGVQDVLVAHIDTILPLFSVSNEEQKTAAYSLIFTHLLAFEVQARRQWRRVHALLIRAETFPCFFSVDQLQEKFVPLLFYYLSNSASPVKKAAGRLLIEWSRRMRATSQHDVFQRLTDDFGKAHSCFHRIEFLDMCACIIEKYSRRFFRERLLETALDLSKDPVANVRMRLCALLPLIKKALRPPSEVPTAVLARFNECVSFLLLDKDRDVSDAAKVAHLRIGEIEAEFQRESKLRIESHDDILDKKKQEDESQAAQMEQEADKAKRRKEIVDRLRNELKKQGSDTPSGGTSITPTTTTAISTTSSISGGLSHHSSAGSLSVSGLTRRPGGSASTTGPKSVGAQGGSILTGPSAASIPKKPATSTIPKSTTTSRITSTRVGAGSSTSTKKLGEKPTTIGTKTRSASTSRSVI